MKPIVSTLHTANGATATATTAKTLLGGGALILPSWAKSILAIYPFAYNDVSNAAFSVNELVEMESNDLQLMPFQVLPAPVNALQGSVGANKCAKPEKYLVGAKCGGGEQLNIYGTSLVAPTTMDIYAGATLVVSNQPAPFRQRHAKVGTLTSSGSTANVDVAGTRYNFSSAQHIIELMGNYTAVAVGTSVSIAGYYKFTSNEFDGVADVKLPMNPIPGSLATTGDTYIDGTSRIEVDIPVTPGQVNVQDYAYFGLAPGTGNFITGVIYE